MAIWIIYTIVHELGHATLMILFGARITGVNVNFLNLQARVSCDGNFSNNQGMLVNLGGILFPVLVWVIFMCLASYGKNGLVEVAKLLSSTTIIGSLGSWVILPILYVAGQSMPGDDVTQFMQCTSLHGYLVAGCFMLLIAYCLSVVFRHVQFHPVELNQPEIIPMATSH